MPAGAALPTDFDLAFFSIVVLVPALRVACRDDDGVPGVGPNSIAYSIAGEVRWSGVKGSTKYRCTTHVKYLQSCGNNLFI